MVITILLSLGTYYIPGIKSLVSLGSEFSRQFGSPGPQVSLPSTTWQLFFNANIIGIAALFL